MDYPERIKVLRNRNTTENHLRHFIKKKNIKKLKNAIHKIMQCLKQQSRSLRKKTFTKQELTFSVHLTQLFNIDHSIKYKLFKKIVLTDDDTE